MKQCTVCRTTYTDDTLRYCLADGSSLISIGEETFERLGQRANIGGPATERINSYPTVASKGPGSPLVKIGIAVLVIGFLTLVAIGTAGALLYMNTGSEAAVKSPTPTPAPTPTPSPQTSLSQADGSEELEKELDALQKQLEEIVKNASGKPTPRSESDDSDGIPTAKVNSPNDGFLALRDKPDAEKGARLAQELLELLLQPVFIQWLRPRVRKLWLPELRLRQLRIL